MLILLVFLDTITDELKDLRVENVKLKKTVSIKQDRVNDLEEALRDTLRQLEKAINRNAIDDDWLLRCVGVNACTQKNRWLKK